MKTKAALPIIALCLALLLPLQLRIDAGMSAADKIDEVLYLPSGDKVKRISFGFDGILADFYWLRSVQYFGRQLLNEQNEFDWARMATVRLDLLYPLLDITTTLDPQYVEAYRFGSLFLPDYNREQAMNLINKGIQHNPQNWRLYQNLGTIHWQFKEYQQASEAFLRGSEQPDAPPWMRVIGGVMLAYGGERSTACQLYSTLLQDALKNNDEITARQMEGQLNRIIALDEVDYMNQLVGRYREATGNCPPALGALVPTLRQASGAVSACGQPIRVQINAQGQPVSPLGQPYRFDAANCKVLMPFDLYEP